jgi:hypothetical protein
LLLKIPSNLFTNLTTSNKSCAKEKSLRASDYSLVILFNLIFNLGFYDKLPMLLSSNAASRPPSTVVLVLPSLLAENAVIIRTKLKFSFP